MNYPPHIQQDIAGSFKKFHLTPHQLSTAQRLSPETCAYFEHLATSLLETLSTLQIRGSSEEQEAQIRNHAYVTGRRQLLLELLAEADDAWGLLAQAAATSAQQT